MGPQDMYVMIAWAEGFAAATIGRHLADRNIAWPCAYLIAGAAGIFMSNVAHSMMEASGRAAHWWSRRQRVRG